MNTLFTVDYLRNYMYSRKTATTAAEDFLQLVVCPVTKAESGSVQNKSHTHSLWQTLV